MPNEPFCTPPHPLTREKFVNLFVTQLHSRGAQQPWVFASRKAKPSAIVSQPDAVVVVAVGENDGEPYVVLTREFRAPLGSFELSVPSGLVDAGESVVDAATREFYEETGLALTQIVHVSPPLASSAGLTDETVALVYGRAKGSVSKQHQTEHEDIEVFLANIADVRAILSSSKPDTISSRLYPILLGFVSADRISLPRV
ncbi:MAG: NUDIX hydrolase [Nibricoccus sp.]